MEVDQNFTQEISLFLEQPFKDDDKIQNFYNMLRD